MLCLLRGETMDPAGIYKSHYHRGNVDYINRTSKKKIWNDVEQTFLILKTQDDKTS